MCFRIILELAKLKTTQNHYISFIFFIFLPLHPYFILSAAPSSLLSIIIHGISYLPQEPLYLKVFPKLISALTIFICHT